MEQRKREVLEALRVLMPTGSYPLMVEELSKLFPSEYASTRGSNDFFPVVLAANPPVRSSPLTGAQMREFVEKSFCAAVDAINEAILSAPRAGGPVYVSSAPLIDLGFNVDVLNEAIRRFEAAGWEVVVGRTEGWFLSPPEEGAP